MKLSLLWIGLIGLAAACSSRDGFQDPPATTPFQQGPCLTSCSTDSTAVVDCNGNVVTACGTYASCVDAVCVDACAAADKTQSAVGCEYYVSKPSARLGGFVNQDASCYAILVANTWPSPVTLSVEYDGTELSSNYFRIPRGKGKDLQYDLLPEGKLPTNELAVLFLAMQEGPQYVSNPSSGDYYTPCPASVGAAYIGQTDVRGSGYGKAFHVRASAPVIAYDIYPYGGAASYIPSSSLLLPTSAWGTDNLAMDGYATSAAEASGGALPYFQIVAQSNDTHVTLLPTVGLSSAGGAAPLAANQSASLTLQAGQYAQFTQWNEVNGTPVAADKPISLVGGTTCANIPSNVVACDSLHQQLPPISQFGNTYVATRYRDRMFGTTTPEVTPWRIMSAADGTLLTYDPPIAGAPAALDRGKWAEFSSTGPFVVTSQDAAHPIYVASYMTAGGSIPSGDGDPEFVNVVPTGQYLSSYLFLTDPTYGNSNLVFVRNTANGQAQDVTLDCVGTLSGWQKVGTSTYEVTNVDLVRGAVPQGACDNGVHRASSAAPFGLTVWGWDQYASYGFPAGMGTKPLNQVVAIPR